MKPWKFVHVTDIHLGSQKSYRYDPGREENWATARGQFEPMKPEILLAGGDLTRDGDPHEYEMQIAKHELEKLPMPYAVIPGNVEVGNKYTDLKTQEILNVNSDSMKRWAMYFGPPNWSFVHKNVRFTGYYAGVAGSGLPEEETFWDFMESLPALPCPQHHVAMMHYPLFVGSIDESNFDASKNEQYNYWYNNIDEPHRSRIFDILKRSGVTIIFSGHTHGRCGIHTVDGVRFCWTPTMGRAPKNTQDTDEWQKNISAVGFHVMEVTGDGIGIEFFPVNPVSTKEQCGPTGHFFTNDHAAKGYPDEYDDEIQKRFEGLT